MPLAPAHSPGFLMWHATHRWQRAIVAALAPFELTHVQFVLLASAWWLNDQGQRPTQAGLAAQAATDVKMTSQVLRALERRGLLVREQDENDTRARRIEVTTAGARLAVRTIAVVERADRAFFSVVDPDEAIALLSRLAGERGG
jgi:DNA-binding MarR family transcriptional regulator